MRDIDVVLEERVQQLMAVKAELSALENHIREQEKRGPAPFLPTLHEHRRRLERQCNNLARNCQELHSLSEACRFLLMRCLHIHGCSDCSQDITLN